MESDPAVFATGAPTITPLGNTWFELNRVEKLSVSTSKYRFTQITKIHIFSLTVPRGVFTHAEAVFLLQFASFDMSARVSSASNQLQWRRSKFCLWCLQHFFTTKHGCFKGTFSLPEGSSSEKC